MRTGAIELTFLGTRGEIELRSRLHRRHSSLLVQYRNARVMIDCGRDWLGRLPAIAPTAILLTHAHPDHAQGLADGAPCPVYATKETFERLDGFPISERRRVPTGKSIVIGGVRFRAYPVQHSIRAPAVGYRVSAQGISFFYLPDVAWLPNASNALRRIDLYIGDGATVRRPLIRQRAGKLIGHAPITAQLAWCQRARVRQAVFTHCGSAIVRGDARRLNALVRRLGGEHEVKAQLACDGCRLSLPGGQLAQPAKQRARRA